jgi:RimJ/RimL family protein N-acetyltransferase
MSTGGPSQDPARSERLSVRSWKPSDREAHFDTYRRWEVAQWLGAEPKALDDPEQSLASIRRWEARNEWPYGLWAVVPDAVGHPVGSVLLMPLQDADGQPVDDVEIGWHLHPDHWGRGYATEAAQLLLRAAWNVGLDEVWAVVRPGNTRSVAVTERLGMQPRGVTARWYGTELESFCRARPVDE